MGRDTLRKSIKTNLGSCRLLPSRDDVEILEAAVEELDDDDELCQSVDHSFILD